MRRCRWAVALVLAAGVALALRLPRLDVRPMHGDEAVHAYKLNLLWQTGRYEYNPHEYHGPTLYYLTLPMLWLRGAGEFADFTAIGLRLVPALCGVAAILLLALLAEGLGRAATAVGAALLALSPAMVFYSRYYIQEMLLVCFTVAAIGCGWRFLRSGRLGWAVAAGVAAGLMHATKETDVIAFICAAAALGGSWLWEQMQRRRGTPSLAGRRQGERALRKMFPPALAAILAAVVVAIALHSGFMTNPRGALDSLLTYTSYLERGTTATGHFHPWYWYLQRLAYTHDAPGPHWSEGLILLLALTGAASVLSGRSVDRADLRLVRFLLLYAVLITAAYSAIPYKTPWCAVQFLWPLALLGGYGAVALLHWLKPAALKALAGATLCVGALNLGDQAVAASFRYAADPRNPYAYAQPLYGVERLGAWVDKLAAVHSDGRDMLIKVVASYEWPLPWYLRGYARVGYWDSPPEEPAAPVIIVSQDLQAQVEARLSGDYQISSFGMRRDYVLFVYAERELYEAFMKQAQRGAPLPPSNPR